MYTSTEEEETTTSPKLEASPKIGENDAIKAQPEQVFIKEERRDELVEETSHTCDICFKSFLVRANLKRHMRKHKKSLVCKVCSYKFSELEKLIRHIESFHLGIKKFQCKICKRKYIMFKELRKHIFLKHRKEFKCGCCDRIFTNKSDLSTHFRTSHEEEVRCEECDEVFRDAESLDLHSINCHQKFECNVCNVDVLGGSELREHVIRSHVEFNTKEQDVQVQGEFVCDLCGKSFRMKCLLRKHKLTHVKTYECDVCKSRFGDRKTLLRHIEGVHLKLRHQECPLCQWSFMKLADMRHHIQERHSGRKDFHCEICDEAYMLEVDLLTHLDLEHEERGQQCPECSHKFRGRVELKKHLYNFHKDLECAICKWRFTGYSSLKDHIIFYHSVCSEQLPAQDIPDGGFEEHEKMHGQRYGCNFCNKTYFRQTNLNRHISALHFNNVDFKCRHCPKEFPTRNKLRWHVHSAHLKSKKQKCLICQKEFTRNSHLILHLGKYHNLEQEYLCLTCSKVFPDEKVLQRHEMRFHRKYSCRICDEVLEGYKLYTSHMKEHKKPGNPEERTEPVVIKKEVQVKEQPTQNFCDICFDCFVSQSELDQHMLDHGDLFTCKLCKETFYSKNCLVKHLRTQHLDFRSYVCAPCGERLFSPQDLDEHISIKHLS